MIGELDCCMQSKPKKNAPLLKAPDKSITLVTVKNKIKITKVEFSFAGD